MLKYLCRHCVSYDGENVQPAVTILIVRSQGWQLVHNHLTQFQRCVEMYLSEAVQHENLYAPLVRDVVPSYEWELKSFTLSQ